MNIYNQVQEGMEEIKNIAHALIESDNIQNSKCLSWKYKIDSSQAKISLFGIKMNKA